VITIRSGNSIIGFEPTHQNLIHRDHVNWLQEEIAKCREEGKDVCVFTHHAPMKRFAQCPLTRRGGDYHSLKYLDYSDQRSLMEISERVKLWGYGHTHHSSSQVFHNSMVVSNCLGYIKKGENDPNFSEEFVVSPFQGHDDLQFIERGHYEIDGDDSDSGNFLNPTNSCTLF